MSDESDSSGIGLLIKAIILFAIWAVLIATKAFGLISWGWLTVIFFPIWFPIAATLAVLGIVIVVVLILTGVVIVTAIVAALLDAK